jgi:hypothetical protein
VTGRECRRCRRVDPIDVVDLGEPGEGERLVCSGCLTTAEQMEHPAVDGRPPTIPTGWDTP